MKKDKKEESSIQIKQTVSNLIKEEEPEMTQEEAIMKYEEPISIKKNKNNSSSDTDETTEDTEHLNRIKKELLESLERVKQLAKKLYGEDVKVKLNVKAKSNKQNGKQRKIGSQENETQKSDNNRERE